MPFIAHAQRVSPRRKFAPFRGALDARGHEVSSIAHAQRVSSRRKFALFRSALDARGHEVSFIAHAQRVSSRRRFALFRGALDAGGHFSRSAVVSRHAKSFPRPINALDAEGHEVSTAPEICPIPWCAGRERTLFPFRSCVSPCQKLPPPYKRPGRGKTRSAFRHTCRASEPRLSSPVIHWFSAKRPGSEKAPPDCPAWRVRYSFGETPYCFLNAREK